MATEPEHPTGELGQSGEQTERTAAALCPYTALLSSPSAQTWAPRKLPSLSDWAVEGKGLVPRGGLSLSELRETSQSQAAEAERFPRESTQGYAAEKSPIKASLDRRPSERALQAEGAGIRNPCLLS